MRLLWIIDRGAIERGIALDVLRAGVRFLQLREPDFGAADWLPLIEQWRREPAAIDVVVNGGSRWAREARCGAHLKAAQPTLAGVERARWRMLGRSVHDAEETRQALLDRPDYLVAGPVWPTGSKPGHDGIGLDGLARIVTVAGEIPVHAIGGVTPARVAGLRRSGARGIVVLSGIGAAEDPAAAALEYLAACGELPADRA